MTGTISELSAGASNPDSSVDVERARRNLSHLLSYVAGLYCMGGSSSVSASEARELAMSVTYVLDIVNATPEEAARVLDVDDPVELWHDGLASLDARVESALDVWQEVVITMPPIRNVALRDTLQSLGELRSRYNTRFSAHEVPCDIDYQLSEPVDPHLMGMDYVEKWLGRLLEETRWIAQFDPESCVEVLERVCPDYRGLHVNLYDLLLPHQDELRLVGTMRPGR